MLAFIIAAVITPPDVVSQLALAMPMCLLYEAGIWAAQVFIKHTKAPEEARCRRPASRSLALLRRLGAASGRRPGVTFSSSGSSRRSTLNFAGVAGLERGDARQQLGHVGDLLARHLDDHVARPDAGLRGRAVLQHAGDQHARAWP